MRALRAKVVVAKAPLPARTVVLALAAGLAIVTSAIWMSPAVIRTGSSTQTRVDPLESAVDGAKVAKDAAAAHLVDLTAQNTALATKVAAAAKVPRPVVKHVVVQTKVRTKVVRKAVRWPRCSDYKWQQDAQKVYLKNLSDPWGLDGAPGGHNDDGIACNQLPKDPKRPASKPVGAYVQPLPPVPTKAQVMAQKNTRFGLYTTQAPYSFAEVNLVAAMMEKKPDTVGYFLGWDQAFRPDAIVDAWRHGALPLLTWESHPNGPQPRTTVDSDYALSKIINGDFDAYIDSYAAGIKKLGMPVVIRLDHEMNGTWYGWSESQKYNAKGQYVQMWKHVHDRFQADGANKYAIWLWAPTRVDDLGQKTIAQYYPGDAYVDWVGMDGYFRNKSTDATFDGTFVKTLGLLRALASKPIYLAEVGVTESGGHKADWINDFFANLPLNPDIIGFSWFNIAVTSGSGASQVTNDWRIDSSGPSILAFKAGLADKRYSNQPAWTA